MTSGYHLSKLLDGSEEEIHQPKTYCQGHRKLHSYDELSVGSLVSHAVQKKNVGSMKLVEFVLSCTSERLVILKAIRDIILFFPAQVKD